MNVRSKLLQKSIMAIGVGTPRRARIRYERRVPTLSPLAAFLSIPPLHRRSKVPSNRVPPSSTRSKPPRPPPAPTSRRSSSPRAPPRGSGQEAGDDATGGPVT
ncbi:hypothetical protein NL676_036971 [Syzygium grande]|nr:hypothetical protein NL676_036971 [Syzygium grande]